MTVRNNFDANATGNQRMTRMITNQSGLSLLGITAVLLTVPSSQARATTIVVARAANEIVIGADSKVTDTYGKELNSQVCKSTPGARSGFKRNRNVPT
jgi:hypothetical protein